MRKLALVSTAMMIFVAAEANAGSESFSADVTQTHPQGGKQTGKIVISDMGLRFDFSNQGQQMVQILLPNEKKARILFPAQKTYMEWAGGGSQMPGSRPASPCETLANSACDMVGENKLGAIVAEKWKIVPQGSKDVITVWWDAGRRMMVRQEFPDGRVMNAAMVGKAKHANRSVERWSVSYMMPSGEMQQAERLFDPELGLAVREKLPNGAVRELSNIKIVKPQKSWFAVPSGYRRVEPPKQQMRQGGQGQQ